MEYQSTQKFVRVSPSKIRPVVFLIKKMSPVQAVKVLPFIGKSASEPLMKVIMTALANARQVGVADTDLVFKEIQIGEGPRLKRGRAGSRGRVKPFKKRMSHIRVVLGLKADEKVVAKKGKKVVAEKIETNEKEAVKAEVEKAPVKKVAKKETK